jgi:hypothetical protein
MIKDMGSRSQILDWMAFDEVSPIGDVRGDYQVAQIIAHHVNSVRDRKRYPDPFPVAAFLLEFDQKRREIPKAQPTKRDWRELKAIAKELAAGYNAKNDKKIALDKRRAEKLKRPAIRS